MIQTSLGRYPLQIQPLFFLTLLLLGSGVGSVGGALTFAVAATLAILVHELGHALVYEHFGHRVQIELVALGGLTRSLEGPDLTPGRHLLVSLAGPAMGFACAAVIAVSLALGLNDVLPAMLLDVATWVAGLSVVWGVFNLLPVHPLDGGQAMGAGLALVWPVRAPVITRVISVVVAGLGVAVAITINAWLLAAFAAFFLFQNAQELKLLWQAHQAQEPLAAANAHLRVGDLPAAWRSLRTVPPNLLQPTFLFGLAEQLAAEGAYNPALEVTSRLFDATAAPDAAVLAASICARSGDVPEAMEWIIRGIEAGLSDVTLLETLDELEPLRRTSAWPEVIAAVKERAAR